MKKFMLLPLATLLATTFTAQAETTETTQQNLTQNFNYVSGGLQISTYNHDLKSSRLGKTDNTAGMYLRGSWNFTDNFFVETRGDATVKDDLTISNSVLGLGYFHPINNDLTVYGLAGFSSTLNELELSNTSNVSTVRRVDDSGITGEIGARYQLMSKWTVEPAVRVADYDKAMYEVRLGNNIKVSDHMSIEANLMHRDYNELKEMSYQLGARYSF
jgi:opacity protein-like surface antigen